MKTKLKIIQFLFLLFLFQNTSAQFQNTYVDALKKHRLDSIVTLQKSSYKTNFIIEKDSILKKYDEIFVHYDLSIDSIDEKNIRFEKINNVKNLNELKFNFDVKQKLINQDELSVVKNAEAANFSGIESIAINALSSFIAGRFKQETLHFAINSYFKKIISPKTENDKAEAKIVKAFFPKLTEQIELLFNNGNSSYYSADLVYLNQVAKNDIENIPNSLINNTDILLPNAPNEIKDLLAISSSIIKSAKNNLPLDEIITNLSNHDYINIELNNTIKLLSTISESLKNEEGKNNVWINPIIKLDPSKINADNIINDTYAFLYLQLAKIKPVKRFIEKDGTELIKVARNIYKLLYVINDLNTIYNSIKEKNFELKTTEDKIIYIKNINNLVSTFITKINNLEVLSINTSNFSKVESYLTIVELFMDKEYTAGISLLSIEFSSMMSNNVKYSRLLNFTSQLATVKSSEEMEKMLQGFAAPIGSSSIKRVSDFSVSLNSYFGLNFGYEKILYNPNNEVNGYYFGVTAPIGFAFSGLSSKTGSWSVIINALDLGSLVNTRINNDSTTYSNLKFEHFFTPGLGVAYNFKGTPLTIGIFGNYISNLKDISYNEGIAIVTATNKDVFRFNISLLVDIPLMNIYKK